MVQRYFAEPKYVTLEIKGMYSEACPKKIEDAVFNMKGVKSVKVDFAKKECRITYNPYFSKTPDFVEVINANGYISKKKSNLKVVDYKIQFQGS